MPQSPRYTVVVVVVVCVLFGVRDTIDAALYTRGMYLQ